MSAIAHGSSDTLPYPDRGRGVWQSVAFLPLLGLLAAFLFANAVSPRPPHLSMRASAPDASSLRVDGVTVGGLAWDAGIKAGDIVLDSEGGKSEVGPPEVLRDPFSVRVRGAATGREIAVDARQTAPVRGALTPVIWLLALLLAVAAWAVAWVRRWDRAGRWLFVLFGFLAVFFAFSTFSGTGGGVAPVLIVGYTLSGAGYALVSLLAVFPYGPAVPDWRRRYLIPAFGVGLGLAWAGITGRLVQESEAAYALSRAALGLYMLAIAAAVVAELLWSLRARHARPRREQIAILLVTLALGLGPLVFVGLVPRLLFSAEPAYSMEIALSAVFLVPVGVAYAVVRYQWSWLYREVGRWLAPTVAAVAAFFVTLLAVSYVEASIGVQGLLATGIALLAGIVATAVAAGVAVALGLGRERGSPEEAEARRRQALGTLYNRLTQAASVAPLLLNSREEGVLQLGPQIEALRVRLQMALGLPSPKEEDLVTSVQSLADEIERLAPFPILFTCSGLERRRGVSSEVTRELYGLARQALSNILLHSQATEVQIRLDFLQDQISFVIADNGVGFDATDWERNPEYTGLREMAQRVQRVGGKFDLLPSLGEGTWLLVTAPYAPPSPPAAP